jgi:hypothetical protein
MQMKRTHSPAELPISEIERQLEAIPEQMDDIRDQVLALLDQHERLEAEAACLIDTLRLRHARYVGDLEGRARGPHA